MVHLMSAPTAFEAKVVAARLGAEGIVWQLRGNVDSLYPVGIIEVLVADDDAELARQLLLVDEVESAFEADQVEDDAEAGGGWWLAVVGVVLLAAFVAARVLSLT